jgi:CBS domain containing-hemolysin-like protein
MPCLLAGSAFFSGSETALFGMSAKQRLDLAATRGDRAAPLVLLSDPRMLLITLLLGNMVVNVLYFVIASVLMQHQPWGGGVAAAIWIGSLLALVLLGEIAPKTLASSRPLAISRIVGGPVLTFHRLIFPLRSLLDRFVVRPLSRLAVPHQLVKPLSLAELDALIDASATDGLVDPQEQRLLADVLSLGRTSVRRAMTPRTRMVSVSIDAPKDAVRAIIHETGLMRLPVHATDVDDIRGMLHVKDWLRNPGDLRDMLRTPIYIPEVTTVDLALQSLRDAGQQTAIVVDEFGGTAGIVSLHDLIEPIVGDIADDATEQPPEARPLGPGRWIVPGDFPADRLMLALLGRRESTMTTETVGGLMTRRLGRAAATGDVVSIANVTLEVHHADDTGTIETAVVSLEEIAE